jgi:hypothetical protein
MVDETLTRLLAPLFPLRIGFPPLNSAISASLFGDNAQVSPALAPNRRPDGENQLLRLM